MISANERTASPAGSDDEPDDMIFLQYAATRIGLFRSCRLPRCRRARRCAGCRWPQDEAGGAPDGDPYPPCITTVEDARRLLDSMDDASREMETMLAQLSAHREADANEDAMDDDPIVWPLPEGRPRARKPGRHGGRRQRRGRAKAQETPSASAEIQNTASCDSAVSSQTKSRCGNSSSRISRPEPISQIMPPSGLR